MISSLMISSLMNKLELFLVFLYIHIFLSNIKYNGDYMKVLIDIREPYEYRMGHIDGSINITKDLLELVPEKYLNKVDSYILYCDSGPNSKRLSNELNKLGYHTMSLSGGYSKWLKNNL